jgi:hypothetical protein
MHEVSLKGKKSENNLHYILMDFTMIHNQISRYNIYTYNLLTNLLIYLRIMQIHLMNIPNCSIYS